jgi:hypothetical protein
VPSRVERAARRREPEAADDDLDRARDHVERLDDIRMLP